MSSTQRPRVYGPAAPSADDFTQHTPALVTNTPSTSIKPRTVSLPDRYEYELSGHTGAVLCVRFNVDGSYCLSGGKDRVLRLWNPHKGLLVKEYKGQHGYEILDAKISHDNAQFSSCGGDRTVFVWDVMSGAVLRRLRAHEARINSVAYNMDSSVLASGSYDKTVRLWDLRSQGRDPIQTLSNAKDSISAVLIEDTTIVSASVDGCLRSYDVRMGKVVTDHVGVAMTWLSISNDHNCMLASCLDNTVKMFDRSTGELLNEYKEHTQHDVKTEACFNNTDAYVISGSEDGKVYCWDLVEATVVQALPAHDNVVTSLAYHPKQVCMVTAGADGLVKVWKRVE